MRRPRWPRSDQFERIFTAALWLVFLIALLAIGLIGIHEVRRREAASMAIQQQQ